jgi:hypothetical protein
MNKSILWVSFMVLFAISACALPAMLLGSGGSTPPELQYIFETPDDPVSVTATLDRERQAEAVIPASGGNLSVTSADGTVFRLDILASALTTDIGLSG